MNEAAGLCGQPLRRSTYSLAATCDCRCHKTLLVSIPKARGAHAQPDGLVQQFDTSPTSSTRIFSQKHFRRSHLPLSYRACAKSEPARGRRSFESASALALLWQFGCRMARVFLIARPVPDEALGPMLAGHAQRLGPWAGLPMEQAATGVPEFPLGL